MVLDVDSVIIGSGFGGAVMACRLAEAGERVVVLERGKRWKAEDFPRTMHQVSEAVGPHGLLEYLAFRKVDVVQGVGVGGGSLHYFNVNLRAPDSVLDSDRWPAEIDSKTLAPFYDRALAMLESAPLGHCVGQSAPPPRTSMFVDAATAAGHTAVAVPIAVHTGPERTHPISKVTQQPCNFCGNCLFGCDRNAKQTLDLNYLALAEQHGAQVLAEHHVDEVARNGDGWIVKTSGEHSRFTARRVVVAAGSLGSTTLLLRCRDVLGTLPDLPAALGHRFSVNGEFLLAHGAETASASDPGIGPPITSMVAVEEGGQIITVQDLGLPDQLLWLLEGATPPVVDRLSRLVQLARRYLQRSFLPGGGGRASVALGNVVRGARYSKVLPFLGMGLDSGEGRIRLTKSGSVDVDWKPSRDKKLYRAIEGLMGDLSHGAGGRFVTSPLWRWPFRKVLTAHPLGGCAMSDDPLTGVVDHRGEVWGHEGLFVVDGSILPGPLAVNPSLTIAALAERAAKLIVDGAASEPAVRKPSYANAAVGEVVGEEKT